jgi:hypothetical protein
MGSPTLPAPLRDQEQTTVRNHQSIAPRLAHASFHPIGNEIETSRFVVRIDPKSGAICKLCNRRSKHARASKGHPLALFSCQTLSQADYSHFFASHAISNEDWAKRDFGRPNIERFGAESRDWLSSVVGLQLEEDQHSHRVLAHLEIDDQEALRSGRASFPQKTYMGTVLPKAEPVIHLNFPWFEKLSTRLPEALWLSFHPMAVEPTGCTEEKSGEPVSPYDVVGSGNRHMHAVSTGFDYPTAFTVTSSTTARGPITLCSSAWT